MDRTNFESDNWWSFVVYALLTRSIKSVVSTTIKLTRKNTLFLTINNF